MAAEGFAATWLRPAVWEQVLEAGSHAAPMALRIAHFHLNLRFIFG
jgi:hypothetical protein